ncbi:MAG: class I SAM-dependent methyltransferase [Methanothrix sp.]|nr:class I SAM-dependent methyltransferase [Methanothrix sp.]
MPLANPVQCPRCRTDLDRRGEKLSCSCGYSFKLRDGIYEVECPQAPEALGYNEQYYQCHLYDYSDYRISRLSFLALARPGHRILDLGCGPGAVAVSFAVLGSQVYGADISRAALKLSAHRARDAGVSLELFEFDGKTLPFKDSSFHTIVMADVAEHVDDETLSCLFRESFRMLLPGGRLVLHTAPALEAMRITGLLRRLTFGTIDLQSRLITPEYEHLHIRYHSQRSIASLLKQSGLDPLVWGEIRYLKDQWPRSVQRTFHRLLTDQVWALGIKGSVPVATFPAAPYLDALEIPSDLNLGHGDEWALGRGFYDPEGGIFRWTEKEAVLYLWAREGCSSLTIQLSAPHPDLESKPLRVVVFLDSRKVKALNITDRNPKTFSFDVSRKLKPGIHKIRLAVDRTFTPRDFGINQDSRKLGVILYEVRLD